MANFPITISPLRKSVVSDAEMISKGFSHKFTVLYSDVINAGAVGATDTVTITLGVTPPWWFIDKALGVVNTAFGPSGGLTVAVGTSATIGALIPATTLLAQANLPMAATLPVGTNANGVAAAGTLQILLTNSVSGSIATLTSGDLDVYINLINTQKGSGGIS